MPEYYLYSRTEWHVLGNRLLEKKSGNGDKNNIRTDFFEACKNKEDFLAFLEKHLKKPSGDKPPPIFETPLTEKQFIAPPPKTAEEIYRTYRDIPSQYVHDHTFWLCVNIEMIKKGIIELSFLANHDNLDGKKNLQKVTKKPTDDKYCDDVVRKILRRLCNAAPRGPRTLISPNDCPISAAYWRQALISLIEQEAKPRLKRKEISSQLNIKQYKNICDSLFSGKSYYGNPKILAGLVVFLKKNKVGKSKVKKLLEAMGKIIAWKAVDLLDINEIAKEFSLLSKK